MDRVTRRPLIALRLIAPEVGKAIFSLGQFIISTVIKFWTGLPGAVSKLVRSLMEEAWEKDFPTEYDTIMRRIFTGLAYVMIIGAWIGLSFLTMFLLVRLIR